MNTPLSALVVVCFAAVAAAQEAPSFEEVDRDGDGVINQEEASAAGLDLTTADKNQDGVVDREEYREATRE